MLLISDGRAATALNGNQCRIVALNIARRNAGDSGLYRLQIVPLPAVMTGSPLFCLDIFHHFDFKIPLSQQLFEPGVLAL